MLKSRKQGPEIDKDWFNEISKSLDMNLVSIKNMKWKFGTSYQLFHFQMRDSPAPLNIPIPTPASDRGDPVACIGSPIASNQSGIIISINKGSPRLKNPEIMEVCVFGVSNNKTEVRLGPNRSK